MSNTGSFLHLDSLGLNREERRKLERTKKKERQKKKPLGMATSVDDVLKQMSTNRKKNSRRK